VSSDSLSERMSRASARGRRVSLQTLDNWAIDARALEQRLDAAQCKIADWECQADAVEQEEADMGRRLAALEAWQADLTRYLEVTCASHMPPRKGAQWELKPAAAGQGQEAPQ
jgi:hypothetical protein